MVAGLIRDTEFPWKFPRSDSFSYNYVATELPVTRVSRADSSSRDNVTVRFTRLQGMPMAYYALTRRQSSAPPTAESLNADFQSLLSVSARARIGTLKLTAQLRAKNKDLRAKDEDLRNLVGDEDLQLGWG